ncbi:MAG: HlyC/CorC family transporter [Acidobacteriota bacterium]|nr:HlyC/CorC family transporter [Acidobacteriota bacterium]
MIGVIWSSGDTALALSVGVLLVLSGFFAMAETALTRTNKSRARSLRDQGRRGAKALVVLTESPERFLNPLLLLILICQLVSATMVGVLAGHLFGAAGVFVATALEVIIIFVAFEAIPKNYAVQHQDEAALLSAPVIGRLLAFAPIRLLSSVLLSVADAVIALVGGTGSSSRVTESEILAMADVAHEDLAIASEERNFIHSVIEFGDTIVREVMVPRIDIVDVPSGATIRDALDLAIETGRSRIPVLGESVDDVVGMVNLRHLARLVANGQGDELVDAHMGQASFVPETKRVASLLSEIRQSKVHLFVVVDEYGGTAGLVTLEDVLEELVGEITDESDPSVEELDEARTIEGGLELSGRLNIDDANEEFGLALEKDGWDTVGGLVLDLAGGVPSVGEVFATRHYRLTVVRMDGRRIESVLVEPRGHDDEDDAP